MISKEEIKLLANTNGLDMSQIEKDYVLGWIIAGIAQNIKSSNTWIFKGGTCLRKTFFPDYRYSEDLDYTIYDTHQSNLRKAPLETIKKTIEEISLWVTKESGIEIDTSRTIFESLENKSQQTIIQGRIFYRGPVSPSSPRQWPRIKFDLTSDEIIVNKPGFRNIFHPYSDKDAVQNIKVMTYDIHDVLAEKIRALFERTRPRDLYDVVEIYQKNPVAFDTEKVIDALAQKCAYKNLNRLFINDLKTQNCQLGWEEQLSHQIASLKPFHTYWNRFLEIANIFEIEK
jgi:predicted nucleotidyltransferase component of viral defense system